MKTPDLFSPGTRLSEIPPDFRGWIWTRYEEACLRAQGDEWRRTHTDAPLSRQALHTARDDYGHKSAGPRGNIATTSRREF